MTQWEQAFAEYLRGERRASDSTVRNYLNDIEQFRLHLHGVDATIGWENVDADLVREWVVYMMDEGIKPSTVNTKLSSIRSFYRFLLLTKRVEHDPVKHVSGPKKDKPLPSFLRVGEMNRLLEMMRNEADMAASETDSPYSRFDSLRDRLIVLMLYMTGMRRAEIIGLDMRDIDLASCQLRVTGKRNKMRVIPFGLELKLAIQEYLVERRKIEDGDPRALFVVNKGGRIGASYVTKMVHNALSRVTTAHKLSPHVLRHTFATAMLNAGADLQSVKELLGHESVATTEVYTHATFEQLRDVYQKSHPRA